MQFLQKQRQWFDTLNSRDQLSVLAGAVAVGLYILIVLLWSPLSQQQQSLVLQNQQAGVSLRNVEALAQQYQALQGGSAKKTNSTGKKNLTSLIDRLVKANGLQMKRFQPSSSGDVQLRFENAVFNNIVMLLHQLETDNAIAIKDLSISPGSAIGLVDISVRLSGGA
ncbi:MAG: general secretion pathway protein M [Paraglaciecola psychrophila]|jgi:general secretion pathway protein M